MAIQPLFASKILTGTKAVEFRKARFNRAVSHIIIYSSSPERKVLGYFTVRQIVEGDPKSLWRKYERISDTEKSYFSRYFGSATTGIAIRIEKVRRLDDPVPLNYVYERDSPPQSFCYMPTEAISRLDSLPGVDRINRTASQS
jgi:predicted transcriptional regulator